MKFRNPNKSRMNEGKIRLLFKRMKDRLTTRDGSNFDSAVADVYATFKRFFTTLGKPSFQHRPLLKYDDPDPDPYNQMLEEIENDLRTAFEEVSVASELVIETFNVAQIAAEELNQRSTAAASKIIDLQLLNGQLDQEVLIAGDDFQSSSKVDTSFSLQNSAADIRTREGVATLSRVESIPVTNLDTRITVTPLSLGNGAVPSSNPTSDNTARFYEGDFFDYIGSARPEGGKWHLEERINPEVIDSVQGDSDTIMTDLNSVDSAIGGAVDQRTGEDRLVGLPLRDEDILVIDRGASPEEKEIIRQRMVDENPDSFWESEYVLNAEEIQSYVTGLDQGQIRDTTPNELRARAVALDNVDLEVQITMELSERSPVNWISMNPMNFGETSWLEVTEVSTADNSSAGFEPIEGFDQNRFANVLTNEANEELQEGTVSDVLAPSRFSFRGSGVWTFPVREAKFIRLKVKQRVPVPDPYQRMALQLNRVIQNTQNYSRGSSGGGCCFIFLEARYGDGTMDQVVRRFRDEHLTVENQRGYYKLSEVLVPLMRRYPLVKGLVRMTMTDPMVSYGKYYYGKNKWGRIFAPVARFWLRLFKYLGQKHPFVRENGEIL